VYRLLHMYLRLHRLVLLWLSPKLLRQMWWLGWLE
jgi:hypothetical protein